MASDDHHGGVAAFFESARRNRGPRDGRYRGLGAAGAAGVAVVTRRRPAARAPGAAVGVRASGGLGGGTVGVKRGARGARSTASSSSGVALRMSFVSLGGVEGGADDLAA